MEREEEDKEQVGQCDRAARPHYFPWRPSDELELSSQQPGSSLAHPEAKQV